MIFSDILRTSSTDYPGRLCAVLFTAGCPFRCHYCHNPELVLPNKISNKGFSEEEVLALLDKRKNLVDAVTISGGEITLHNSLLNFIKKLKSKGYLVKIDTNGVNPEMVKELLPFVDYVAMDVKAVLETEHYIETVGTDVDMNKIKESIRLIIDYGVEHEFRTTVVPSLFPKHLFHSLGGELEGAKRHIIQGFKNGKTLNPDYSGMRMHTESELEEIRKIMSCYVDDVKIR